MPELAVNNWSLTFSDAEAKETIDDLTAGLEGKGRGKYKVEYNSVACKQCGGHIACPEVYEYCPFCGTKREVKL